MLISIFNILRGTSYTDWMHKCVFVHIQYHMVGKFYEGLLLFILRGYNCTQGGKKTVTSMQVA